MSATRQKAAAGNSDSPRLRMPANRLQRAESSTKACARLLLRRCDSLWKPPECRLQGVPERTKYIRPPAVCIAIAADSA